MTQDSSPLKLVESSQTGRDVGGKDRDTTNCPMDTNLPVFLFRNERGVKWRVRIKKVLCEGKVLRLFDFHSKLCTLKLWLVDWNVY